MARDPLHHPIQAAIEDIWEAGHTPRIQVDAEREDVRVPEFVRAKWGARLVLDLDASWPLNFAASAVGIELDLAFAGVVTRCALPWEAIYVVIDRATGRGIVIESHVPASAREGASAPRGSEGSETKTPARGSARPRAVQRTDSAEPSKAAGPPRAAQPSKAAEKGGPPVDASTDEEAKKRRARFRVIDGGR